VEDPTNHYAKGPLENDGIGGLIGVKGG
jgi:hypothetical protein